MTTRVAVVTGAARGIGAATAERLARDGMPVGVLDLDEAACEEVAARIREAGGRAVGVGV
ncbi:MAG: SDR family NAD(P)-dependent oxidoreductase, partial [Phycicoccus sp.]